MRTDRVLLVTIVATALSGCGSPGSSAADFAGEEAAVAETVEGLQEAGQRREPDRICADVLSASLRSAMASGRLQCETEVEKALEDSDAFELDVQDVTITGPRATARVKAEDEADGVIRTLELVKERGRWRIASLGT